ncbi:MAG TPA: adenosine deaminase [Alphaproteobacteria bacterium]|nr:adenosine deaminase [Alphaproteobacteria bacterium]HOO51305.1 adenosine deaminase [Alphaproteobacteria bacterium]
MTPEIKAIPKAELHVHIEGTVTPEIARMIAKRNAIDLDPDIFSEDGTSYKWNGFIDLVTRVYQEMARGMKTAEDFETIMYDYLCRCAEEGAIYVEPSGSPGQCLVSGISYKDMVDGMARGMDRARKDTGIESRLTMTFERHRPNGAESDAELILSYKHPYIVGLDIAGGEQEGDLVAFEQSYKRVLEEFGRPIGSRAHAAENIGPVNGWDALKRLPLNRMGHGVRCIEDAKLIQELIKRDVTLEVCPTSNILAVKEFPNFKSHPLRKLFNAGVSICLNSDDPGLFGTSIGNEYQIAHDEFGFSEDELLAITRNAIAASFAPQDVKEKLLLRIAP